MLLTCGGGLWCSKPTWRSCKLPRPHEFWVGLYSQVTYQIFSLKVSIVSASVKFLGSLETVGDFWSSFSLYRKQIPLQRRLETFPSSMWSRSQATKSFLTLRRRCALEVPAYRVPTTSPVILLLCIIYHFIRTDFYMFVYTTTQAVNIIIMFHTVPWEMASLINSAIFVSLPQGISVFAKRKHFRWTMYYQDDLYSICNLLSGIGTRNT